MDKFTNELSGKRVYYYRLRKVKSDTQIMDKVECYYVRDFWLLTSSVRENKTAKKVITWDNHVNGDVSVPNKIWWKTKGSASKRKINIV